VPCDWGWRWPPNWWCRRAASGQKFAYFVVDRPLLSQGLFTCVNLPYSALASELTVDHQPCAPAEHGALHRLRSLPDSAAFVLGGPAGPRLEPSEHLSMGLASGLLIILEPWAALGSVASRAIASGPPADPEPMTPVCDRIWQNTMVVFLRVAASTCCSGAGLASCKCNPPNVSR